MEKSNPVYSEREQEYRTSIQEKLTSLKRYLTKQGVSAYQHPENWYLHLNQIKQILGNLNNDVSFVASLLAKIYLQHKFGVIEFDAAEKPQAVDLRRNLNHSWH